MRGPNSPEVRPSAAIAATAAPTPGLRLWWREAPGESEATSSSRGNALAQKDEVIKDLNAQLSAAKRKVEASDRQNELLLSMRHQVSALQTSRELAHNELKLADAEITDYKQQLAAAEGHHASFRATLAQRQTTLTQRNNRINELQARVTSLDRKLQAEVSKGWDYEATLEDLRRRLAASEEQHVATQEQAREHDVRIADCDVEIHELKRRVRALEAELAASQAELVLVSKSTQDLREYQAALAKDFRNLHDAHGRLKLEHNECPKLIAGLRRQINLTKDALELNNTQTLEDAKAAKAKFESETAELKMQLQARVKLATATPTAARGGRSSSGPVRTHGAARLGLCP